MYCANLMRLIVLLLVAALCCGTPSAQEKPKQSTPAELPAPEVEAAAQAPTPPASEEAAPVVTEEAPAAPAPATVPEALASPAPEGAIAEVPADLGMDAIAPPAEAPTTEQPVLSPTLVEGEAPPEPAPLPVPVPETVPAPVEEKTEAPKATTEKASKKSNSPAKKEPTKKKATEPEAAPPPPPPPPPIMEEIAQVEERIKALDEEIATIETAQPQVEGAPPNTRLEFLRRVRLLQQRRISSLTRIRQLEEQLAEQAKPAEAKPSETKPEEAEGENESQPLDIQAFDVLLDQLDAAQRQLEGQTQSAASQAQAAKRAAQFYDEAGRSRRAAEETHAKAVAAGGGVAEFVVLEEARQGEALAELQAKVEDTLARVAALELKSAEQGVTLARESVVAGALRLVITNDALDALVKGISDQREGLQKSLSGLYRQREKDDEQLYKQRQSAATAAPEAAELAKERVANAEMALNATNSGIQTHEQRIANLATEETAWQDRVGLFRNTLDGSYARRLKETTERLEVLRDAMAQAESRTRNILSLRLELDRRIASPDISGDLRTLLQKRIETLSKQEGYDRDYLNDLTRQEKLQRRIEWGLRRGLEEQGFLAQFYRAREVGLVVWNYELFVFEERGFTVSTLVFAVLAYGGTLFGLLFVRRRMHKLLIRVLTKRAGSDNATLRDVGLTFINGTNTLVLVVLSLWPALRYLPLNESVQALLISVFYLTILGQCAIYATNWIERTVNRHKMRRLKEDPSSVSAYGVMSFFARIAIWTVVLLICLASFGINISGVVAGLGIGGVAVAFALQSILADIFSSVAILLDKPFMVGDVITVGTETGEIESIGLKTTRMKSVTGEQVVISNNDLLGSRIRNFKRMSERRVLFQIGVTYQTGIEHLELIPVILRELVESKEKVRFDRAHFKSFGDFALIFECVYFMTEPDYLLYMDTNQAIHLELFRRFHELGIEFAYPTQTLYIHMEGGQGPAIKVTAAETGTSGDTAA